MTTTTSVLHCALAAVHAVSRTFCTSLSRSAHDLSLFCTSSANTGLQLKTSTQSRRLWEGEVRVREGKERGGKERGGEGRGGEGRGREVRVIAMDHTACLQFKNPVMNTEQSK